MYGIYEGQINYLNGVIKGIDERVYRLSAVLELVGDVDDGLNDWLNDTIRELDSLKKSLEQEISELKEKWRQSRPKTDYRPMDDTDLLVEIRVKGYVKGSLM